MQSELKKRAEKVIPGGMYGHESTKLLPANYPQFFARAEGAYLWDTDGKRYLDFMCAYGPNLFGYANAQIDAAAAEQMRQGDVMTGPGPAMVDLAEALVAMVSHADWAMFCKNGTDATTMAMTTARAQTGRRVILVADGAYHGAAPWNTPMPAGIVTEERAFIRKYVYNDIASLEAAVAAAGTDLAGIFATPFRHEVFEDQYLPDLAYARRARELCDKNRAILIVDDVRAGFRLARDCSWETLGVRPDLSCWGKALANGLPISALLGADNCRDGAKDIFVTGSFWFGAVPMAAAIETLRLIRETPYLEEMVRQGAMLRTGWDRAARKHGFSIRQTGPVQMPQLLFDDDPDFRIGHGFAERMLDRGIYIHPYHNMFLCAAMTDQDIQDAIFAADEAFASLRRDFTHLQPHPVVGAMLSAKAKTPVAS